MTERRGLPVLHGYTTGDLDRFAQRAGRSAHVSSPGVWDLRERVELAWSAIAEALVMAEEPPTAGELIQAGRRAVYRGGQEHRREHGFGERGAMPSFATYWWQTFESDHAPRIVERGALDQIWPLLLETDRRALVALAVYDDYHVAADAVGLKYGAFCMRIRAARWRFLKHWWAPYVPVAALWRDRRVGRSGQPANARAALDRAREQYRRARRRLKVARVAEAR